MDAKVVPKSSPEAKSIGSQLEGYESDEVEDLNHDAHGLLRETDPQYPNMDEEGSDAYETDNSSDLEETNADGSPTLKQQKKIAKRKKKELSEGQEKANRAAAAHGDKRKQMQKEIVALIIDELIPPDMEVDLEPPAPIKRQGWMSKQCTLLGKFFGCLTLDLHEAVLAGMDKEMDEALQKVHQGKKSRRELCNVYDKNGMTPLSLAIKTKQPNIAFAILGRKVNPDVPDLESGRTPLFYACMQGKLPINQMLIAAGADPGYGDFKACTPLMMAAAAKDHRTIKYICGLRIKLELDAQDFNGWTALHYAASTDGWKAIKELLAAGADRHITDLNKRKALHIAKMHEFGDSMAQLEDTKSRLAALDEND